MKKKSILLSLVALCVLALFSCSDKNDAPSYSSKALKNAELVNILKAKGYTFNENGQLALNELVNNTTSLDLSGTKLKDLTELDIFPNLHELKLANNGYGPTFDFDSIPAKITAIDLTGNEIYDYNHLVKVAVAENGEETITPEHTVTKLVLPASARFNSKDLVRFYRHNQSEIKAGKVEMKMADAQGTLQTYNTLRSISDATVLNYIKKTYPSIVASDGKHIDLNKHFSLTERAAAFTLYVGDEQSTPTSLEGVEYIVANPEWEGTLLSVILKKKASLSYLHLNDKLQRMNLKNVDVSGGINFDDAQHLSAIYLINVSGVHKVNLSKSIFFGQRGKDAEFDEMNGTLVDIANCLDIEQLLLPNKSNLHGAKVALLNVPKLQAVDLSNFVGLSSIELGLLPATCKLTYPVVLKDWNDYGGYLKDEELFTTFVITEAVFNLKSTQDFIKKFYIDSTPKRLGAYNSFTEEDEAVHNVSGIFWNNSKYISKIH